ncbi:MAG: hypothetical protein ABIT07_00065 [Ferruginibacter sp.]
MYKHLILYFIFIFCSCKIHAQGKQLQVPDSTSQNIDERKPVDALDLNLITADTLLDVREIDILPDTINSWKNNNAFRYEKNLDSLLKALQRKSAKDNSKENAAQAVSFLGRLLNGPFLQILLWLLAACFLGFILYSLFLTKGVFNKRKTKTAGTFDTITEGQFLNQDFATLVHQAYKLQDFRLATRYLFLQTLQKLHGQSLIEFTPEKTNNKYMFELPANIRNDFATLVLNYEYVWYGNIPLRQELFEKIENEFSAFLKRV